MTTTETLRGYASAYRFLNLVLADVEPNGDDLFFPFHYISIYGEIECHDGRISSSDPAYYPHDWEAAVAGRHRFDPVGTYAALLAFLHAFCKRGSSIRFDAMVATLEPGSDGLPVDALLRARWLAAYGEAKAAPGPSYLATMTLSPFIIRE